MRLWAALLTLGVLLAVYSGCTRSNPAYCDDATPCEFGRCNLELNSCGEERLSCERDSDCLDPSAGLCAPDGMCAECVDNLACSDDQPICGGGTCRGCAQHRECASDLCTDSGACAAEEEVLYVSASNGSDSSACGTRAVPCRTIAAALAHLPAAGARRNLKIGPGIYDERIKLDGSLGPESVRLYGPGPRGAGAVVLGGLGGALIADDGVHAEVFDLELAPTRGIDGAVCDGRFGPTILRVKRVMVRGAGVGIRAEQCELLSVEESRVEGNSGGGILADGTNTVRVVNSLITRNGSAGARAGGVAVRGPVSAESVFAWNTVVRNGAGSIAPGVACDGAVMPVVNSIIWRNLAVGVPEVTGSCAWRHTIIGRGAPEGTAILSVDPLFIDENGEQTDFRLRDQSPAIGAGDPDFSLERAFDLAGRPRVGPAVTDLGAFAR